MLRFIFATALALAPAAEAQDNAKLELGKEVFLERAEPQCALCHVLADAGSEGDIGPVLDQLQPDEEQVATAVRNGVDIMPAYGDMLSDEEIAAVAYYVSTAAGQGE